MNNCYRKLYPYNNEQQNQMLSWVMYWLHGHVVRDGNVMVGILGGGWLGEWVGGWSGRSHIIIHCAHINSSQCIPV